MALHPAPTVEAALVLVTQKFSGGSVTPRDSEVTYACLDTAAHTAQTAANAIQTAFNANWTATAFMDFVTVLPPEVKYGDGSNEPAEATATGAGVAGTVTADPSPPAVAVLVKKTTGFSGKRNRGRMYMPWMLVDAIVDAGGFITPANLATMQAGADAFLTALGVAGLHMWIANKAMVLSPGDKHPHVTAITAGHEVTKLTVESMVATQRRRQRS